MSASGGPDIVQDGLVLHLDAADVKSYPKSGTVWYDRSGNGNDGVINGPTFENNTWSFDGNNDIVTVDSTAFNKTVDDEMSVGIWMCPLKNGSSYQELVCNRESTFNWMLYQHIDGGEISFHGAGQYKSSYIPTLNKWIYVIATVKSRISKVYVNGNKEYEGEYFFGGNLPSKMGIGKIPNDLEPYYGKIAMVQFYSRALTQAEVLQNYNATKSRFGLI